MSVQSPSHHQRGAAAVEFAVVASVFFMLLIGAMEMGRLLFYWNTAVEATRLGARIAVVCDVGDNVVKTKITSLFPLLAGTNIDVTYLPAGCTAANCMSVSVSVTGVTVDTFIPYVPLSLAMPAFTTSLPRESLVSASNPMCI